MLQVLLSTYNGEKHLAPLLDSVLGQAYPHLTLLVRDDGSSDGTMAILREYASSFSNIDVLPGGHLGIAGSYFRLIEHASERADYLAFCDQDDIWQPDKASRAVAWLQRSAANRPALYCSRVALVDEHLRFVRLSDVPARGLSFRNALVEPAVWGCTMVVNRAARTLLLRGSPTCAWVHDTWIYLVVSAFGVVLFDPDARILHRRHRTNSSLVPLSGTDRLRIQWRRFLEHSHEQRVVRQAGEFMRIHGDALSESDRQTVRRLLESRASAWDRLRYAWSCDVYHQSRPGNLMLRALIAMDRLY